MNDVNTVLVSDHTREQALTSEQGLTVPQFVPDGGPQSPAEGGVGQGKGEVAIAAPEAVVQAGKPEKPWFKPPEQRRFSKEQKARKRREQDAARSAADVAERLKNGRVPTREMLAMADPEALAAHLRQPLGIAAARREEPGQRGAIGRPLEYSEQEGNDLLAWIQEGKSMQGWLELNGRKASTVYRWMSRVPAFREQYALAMEDRADTLVDQMLDLADKLTADGRYPTMEQVKAVELQVNTRKWCAERMRPQRWALQADRQPAQSITFNISTGRRIAESQPLTIEQGTASEPQHMLAHAIAQSEPADR